MGVVENELTAAPGVNEAVGSGICRAASAGNGETSPDIAHKLLPIISSAMTTCGINKRLR
jgi:hypothetical protein